MNREWKPGDVARIDYGDGSWDRALRVNNGWQVPGGCHRPDMPARPLVVIDPEDREAVERLDSLYLDDKNDFDDTVDGMQAALREYADLKPPKPDEPTGLGAVVEDEREIKWVRIAVGQYGWVEANFMSQFDDTEDFDGTRYEQIAAVRVLSEGWTA